MNRYHVKMPDKWKGPAKIVIAIPTGSGAAPTKFNKLQTDKEAPDFPKKTLWLRDDVALDLKTKGFDVRKAKPPAPTKSLKEELKGDQ